MDCYQSTHNPTGAQKKHLQIGTTLCCSSVWLAQISPPCGLICHLFSFIYLLISPAEYIITPLISTQLLFTKQIHNSSASQRQGGSLLLYNDATAKKKNKSGRGTGTQTFPATNQSSHSFPLRFYIRPTTRNTSLPPLNFHSMLKSKKRARVGEQFDG